MRVFITFIKPAASIVEFIITFSLSMFSKFIKIKIMRKHLEYKIIKKIFNGHKNLIISNFRDLLFDSLTKVFAIFVFFANYINKFNIFEFTIYK